MKICTYEVRTKKNISLTQLAKKTGISSSTLDNFENYKSSPRLCHLEKIAIALDCKITDLFESEYK